MLLGINLEQEGSTFKIQTKIRAGAEDIKKGI